MFFTIYTSHILIDIYILIYIIVLVVFVVAFDLGSGLANLVLPSLLWGWKVFLTWGLDSEFFFKRENHLEKKAFLGYVAMFTNAFSLRCLSGMTNVGKIT